MIRLFVHRDLVSIHKQTILGPLYFLITPIIATLISTLIFGKIANLSTEGIPQFLFYMSGNLFWGYFSTCLEAGKSIFSANTSLFSQVYFPRFLGINPVSFILPIRKSKPGSFIALFASN